MGRTFWVVVGIVGLLFVMVWQAAHTTFLFKHPRTRGHRVIIDNTTGAAVLASVAEAAQAAASQPPTKAAPAALPKAVIKRAHYDFGVMDPLTMGRHDFTIHNEGTAPLRIMVGETTCKCTLSGLDRKEVPPGESAVVTMEWNTGRHENFAQAGTIHTSDPLCQAFDLRITGNVRVLLGLDQADLALGTIDPDQPTVAQRLIYSQFYGDFKVTKLDSTLAGLAWEVLPVDPGAEPELAAKAVRKLKLTIPGGRPQGAFNDTLRLTVQPAGENTEPQQLVLPLAGVVPRRLAFYGPAIDDRGIIELGDVREGQTAQVQILAKVRDRELALPQTAVEISPEFLRAKFEPVANKPGLYALTVNLPPGVSPCQYHNDRTGLVRIDTGHPRIGAVELKVTFAVVGRQSL